MGVQTFLSVVNHGWTRIDTDKFLILPDSQTGMLMPHYAKISLRVSLAGGAGNLHGWTGIM